ncbi:GCN5-related N-acetyltransferase [Micromonospora lupini str. Lupac 08]|uniref:GCN5-related N-acetyltransferase n=1 Tax=Micromonospora lupini str. Lupac 08 TaxID=1150864 RepID=I0L1S5_9ACTN|nr:GCN5-related N-acetyltransferase [Micromonospora lupini str. Lupac 08]
MAILTAELQGDPLAQWLMPDPEQRTYISHRLLAVEVSHAVEQGGVDVLSDMSGAAMWRRYPADGGPVLTGQHLGTFTGPALPRFEQVTSALRSYQSAAPHYWLSWLSVHQDFRRQGIAGDLLACRHRAIDEIGYPISTVVTTRATRDLLAVHGYRAELPMQLPGGPTLWPLRRRGRPVTTAQTGTAPAE